MIVLYLEALVAIIISLSVLMAIAWMAQRRIGNSGRVDINWTFSVGVVGSALWPIAGAASDARRALSRLTVAHQHALSAAAPPRFAIAGGNFLDCNLFQDCKLPRCRRDASPSI
jgi:hypothetical protein